MPPLEIQMGIRTTTKTFQKIAAAMLTGLLLAVSLTSLRTGHAAAANYPINYGGNGTLLAVHLQNASGNQSSYQVSATRVKPKQTYTFSYKPNGAYGDTSPLFLSPDLGVSGASTCSGASSPDEQDSMIFSISVTQNGKSAAPATTYSFCGNPNALGYVNQKNVSVTPAGASTASISGTLQYTDSSGATQPFPSATNATLTETTGSKNTVKLTLDSKGHFSASNLEPGTYTLNASYEPAAGGGEGGAIYGPATFTLKAGANNLGNLSSSDPPPSGGGSDSSCGTDSNGNATDCNNDNLDCGGGSWNWLICPAIQLAQSAANKLDSFIMNTLDIDVKPIFDQTTTKGTASYGYYTAWNSFRIIAVAILIVGGLIMVASQAMGFEVLDAYTVRKVLPRILVAVIGIALSWPLMRLVVSFFDTAGFDIRSLMYAPFAHMGGSISITTGILSTVGVGAALLVMGPAALTFVLTALLAVFVGFVILVVRQIAIIVLIILAPVAIACYILPNTQKVWKLWSENFLGLMLMFPIISALIAAGHIFAAITVRGGSGNTGGVVAEGIGIIAWFAPYFLLPLAARMATGAIGNLAGMVNDRSKGAFDRLKKYRGAKAAENFGKMKSGERFSDRNVLTRGFNRTTASIGTGTKGHFGLGTRGSQAVDQARRNAAMNSVMKSPGWATIQENDDALRAATYNSAAAARSGLTARYTREIDTAEHAGTITAAEAARRRAQVSTRVESSIGAAQAAVGFGRPQAIAAAQQLATTGTGYTDMEDQARTIARASGGDKSTAASIAGYNNFINKQKGRYDLAPGAGNLIGLAHDEIDGKKSATQMQAEYTRTTIAGAQSADAVTLLRGKNPQVRNLVSALATQYRNDPNNTMLRDQVQDLYDSLSYASPENQAAVHEHLDQFGITSRRVGNDPNDPHNQQT